MTSDLELRLKAGDVTVFSEVFTVHRSRIWQIIHFRLNDQVRGRVDPDDVVQEIYLAAAQRIKHFIEGDFASCFLWLRLVASQTLSKIHRTHLGTAGRCAFRETNTLGHNRWGKTSLCLSQRFVAHMASPSHAAIKVETISQIRNALEGMNEIDREVLSLRHFEELTNQEVASELGIKSKAASIRYMRALERLRGCLKDCS